MAKARKSKPYKTNRSNQVKRLKLIIKNQELLKRLRSLSQSPDPEPVFTDIRFLTGIE